MFIQLSFASNGAVQRGQIPIPFSVNRRNYLSNLQAVVADPLTGEEMQALSRIDRNCRLTKGDVFLWKRIKHGKISGT